MSVIRLCLKEYCWCQGGKSEIEQKYAKRMVMRDEYM